VRVFGREAKKRQKGSAKDTEKVRARKANYAERKREEKALYAAEMRAQKARDAADIRAQKARATAVFAAQSVAKAAALKSMTWQEAEHAACDWMQRNGYPDAAVTPSGPDGGVDILSRKAIGQVKHHGKPVGVAEVQRLSGISAHEGKEAFLFAANGVTKSALAFAVKAEVTCVTYPPFTRL
jgi:Restriction endonuclease